MKTTKTVQTYKNTAAESNRSTLENSKARFADNSKIKEQNKKDHPKDGKNNPWDFTCPKYDQRHSSFINAGTHFGLATAQPVGHSGNPKETVPCLPRTRVNTQQIADLG